MAMTGYHYTLPIKLVPSNACMMIYNMCQKARAKDYYKFGVQVSITFLEVIGSSITKLDNIFGCVVN
jgi:hypothetical protein